jgi:hypothetical protein
MEGMDYGGMEDEDDEADDKGHVHGENCNHGDENKKGKKLL